MRCEGRNWPAREAHWVLGDWRAARWPVKAGGQIGAGRDEHGDAAGPRAGQTPTPIGNNDDRTRGQVRCRREADRSNQRSLRASGGLALSPKDYGPSRLAVERDSGGFGPRAWRGHAQWPDSAAGPAYAAHAVLLVRRSRNSKSDRDRSGGRQELERGNGHTKIVGRTCHRSIPRGMLCVLVMWPRFATSAPPGRPISN